uniref:Uncharacterized protein n=1 Tax=Brassica oleracea TaxID=3712 RepID=A0A3P6BG78_BRAOL|nr:unnamed protein product [Brassica oleracea]
MEINTRVRVFSTSIRVSPQKLLSRLVANIMRRKRTDRVPWMQDMGSSQVPSFLRPTVSSILYGFFQRGLDFKDRSLLYSSLHPRS